MFLEADNDIGGRYLTLRYLLADNVDVAMHVGLEGSEFVGGKPQEMLSVSLGLLLVSLGVLLVGLKMRLVSLRVLLVGLKVFLVVWKCFWSV